MYYIRKKGKVLGPFSVEKLREMVDGGILLPEHKISEDKVNWRLAGEAKNLFDAPASGADLASPEPVDSPPPEKVPSSPEPSPVEATVERPTPSPPPSVPPPPPTRPLEGERNENVSFFAMFWNPAATLPGIYHKYEAGKCVFLGLALMALSYVCVVIAVTVMNVIFGLGGYLAAPFLAAVPFVTLVVTVVLVRLIFAKGGGGAFHGDVLIVGTALLPMAFFALIVMALNMLSPSDPFIVVTVGLMLYAFNFTTLVLFGGCVRVDGIRESTSVFVIPIIIIVTYIVTALFFMAVY